MSVIPTTVGKALFISRRIDQPMPKGNERIVFLGEDLTNEVVVLAFSEALVCYQEGKHEYALKVNDVLDYISRVLPSEAYKVFKEKADAIIG